MQKEATAVAAAEEWAESEVESATATTWKHKSIYWIVVHFVNSVLNEVGILNKLQIFCIYIIKNRNKVKWNLFAQVFGKLIWIVVKCINRL